MHDIATLAGVALTALAGGGGGAWWMRGRRENGSTNHSDRLRVMETKVAVLETNEGHTVGTLTELKNDVKELLRRTPAR